MSRFVDVLQPRPPQPAAVAEKSLASIGIFQLAISVILLSSAWPLTKAAIAAGSTPVWFAEGRSVLSGVTITALLALRRRLPLPSRADLVAIAAIGGLQLGLYFLLAHEAVAWVQAGRTAILANTTTIWVVPLSLIFLRERIPPARWLAAALGLLGVGVLASPWSIDWHVPGLLFGHVLLLGAGLAWSVAILVMRVTVPRLSLFELMPWCFLLSSIILLPLLLWHAPDGTFGTAHISWLALAYIGLIAGPFGTWCVVEATAALPAVVSSIGFLSTPAVSLLLANLFLGEPLTADLLGGSALIMAGVVCAARPRRSA